MSRDKPKMNIGMIEIFSIFFLILSFGLFKTHHYIIAVIMLIIFILMIATRIPKIINLIKNYYSKIKSEVNSIKESN